MLESDVFLRIGAADLPQHGHRVDRIELGKLRGLLE